MKHKIAYIVCLLAFVSCIPTDSKSPTRPFVKIVSDSEDAATYVVQKDACKLTTTIPKGLDRNSIEFNFSCKFAKKSTRMMLLDILLEYLVKNNDGSLPFNGFVLNLQPDALADSCEISKRLSEHIFKFDEWDPVKGKSKKCDENKIGQFNCEVRLQFIIVQIANAKDVYEEYTELFRKNGYKIEISYVDDPQVDEIANIATTKCPNYANLPYQTFWKIPFDAKAHFLIKKKIIISR